MITDSKTYIMKNVLIIAFLIMIISSCSKNDDNIYMLNVSEDVFEELNQKIESISLKTKNGFNVVYKEMVGTLESDKYKIYSHIGTYKTTDEYMEFMDYCDIQDNKIYLLLIKKVIQDYNYLASEALKDIAENEFGHSLVYTKERGISEEDVKAAYIVLIEKIIYEI